MHSIDDLKLLIPPPTSAVEIPSVDDWKQYERALTKLPEDYKSFIGVYGTGVIDNFMGVYNPAATNNYLNLLWQTKTILEALRVTSVEFPSAFPMARFPEPGGFLPFAGTDNGDTVFWVTEGNPNAWTVAAMDARSPEVFSYEGGMVDFLIDVLSGCVQCPVFPSSFPGQKPISFSG